MSTTFKELMDYLKSIQSDTELIVIEMENDGYSKTGKIISLNIHSLNDNVEYTNMTGGDIDE